jgi:hypothetical protein
MRQLPTWFDDYDEVAPHRGLHMKMPRESDSSTRTRWNLNPVVEEMFSPDRKLKIEIRRRDDGGLQLFALYWYEDSVPEYGQVASGWAQMPTYVTITDTLERARELADELLRAT